MYPKVGLIIFSLVLTSTAISGSEVEVIRHAVTDWVECGFGSNPTTCLEERTIRSLHEINVDLRNRFSPQLSEREGRALNGTHEVDPLELENQELVRKIQQRRVEPRGIIDEIGDLFSTLTFRLLDPFTGGSSDEENSENSVDNDESEPIQERGHKKKELKKKNKQLKLILLLMLLKNKVKMFVNKLQFLVQLKFLLVATVNMLANVIRLWIELKKKHKPSKVVYYENAHHQHHYDHEHVIDHDDDHHHYSHPGSFSHHAHHYEDDEHGGGGIWPWSRSYAEKQNEPTYHRVNAYGRNERLWRRSRYNPIYKDILTMSLPEYLLNPERNVKECASSRCEEI